MIQTEILPENTSDEAQIVSKNDQRGERNTRERSGDTTRAYGVVKVKLNLRLTSANAK